MTSFDSEEEDVHIKDNEYEDYRNYGPELFVPNPTLYHIRDKNENPFTFSSPVEQYELLMKIYHPEEHSNLIYISHKHKPIIANLITVFINEINGLNNRVYREEEEMIANRRTFGREIEANTNLRNINILDKIIDKRKDMLKKLQRMLHTGHN